MRYAPTWRLVIVSVVVALGQTPDSSPKSRDHPCATIIGVLPPGVRSPTIDIPLFWCRPAGLVRPCRSSQRSYRTLRVWPNGRFAASRRSWQGSFSPLSRPRSSAVQRAGGPGERRAGIAGPFGRLFAAAHLLLERRYPPAGRLPTRARAGPPEALGRQWSTLQATAVESLALAFAGRSLAARRVGDDARAHSASPCASVHRCRCARRRAAFHRRGATPPDWCSACPSLVAGRQVRRRSCAIGAGRV